MTENIKKLIGAIYFANKRELVILFICLATLAIVILVKRCETPSPQVIIQKEILKNETQIQQIENAEQDSINAVFDRLYGVERKRTK